jgi:hypothetical protein
MIAANFETGRERNGVGYADNVYFSGDSQFDFRDFGFHQELAVYHRSAQCITVTKMQHFNAPQFETPNLQIDL